jgi:CRISPR-associated protein Cmr2
MMRELVNALQSGKKSEDEFVEERLRLYRLFGNEKDGTADFLNRAWALHRVGPPPDDEHKKEEWERRFQETVKQVAGEFEDRLREEGYRVGDIEGFQGRLHFYPTFFDQIGLEVINPHDRKTGAGKQPIYFECVPAETKGTFTLLYVPIGAGPTDEETCKKDLKAVACGIKAMLTVYGFGAKTSSGYGVADVNKGKSKILPEEWRDLFWEAWENKKCLI